MKKEISEIGKQMLLYQEDLAKRYKYAPIEPNLLDGDVREKYLEALPDWCCLTGDNVPLCTVAGTVICSAYEKIVVGDYGAYIQMAEEQMNLSVLRCKPGEEYRYQDERYAKNVKYLWLTPKDDSDCKVYLQKKTVEYANYEPKKFYISVYEVFPYEGEV